MKPNDPKGGADSQAQPSNDDMVPRPSAATADFPIVALGASAGGLEALRRLFSHLPVDPGLAFVVIQHLDPDRPSMLSRVIEGITQLPVSEATDGVRLQPNRVHVIPPGADMTIHHGIVGL